MKKTASQSPSSETAAVTLAQSLQFSDGAQAAAAIEELAGRHPKNAELQLCLARLRLRRREGEKAEEPLRRAVALKAGAEASLLLGELLKSRGEAAAARPHLKKAAADAPRSDDAHARLAAGLTRFRAQVGLGDFASAFREADALLASVGSQECIDSFFVSPGPDETVPTLEALKTFAAANPKNPWPRYFRAALLSNMGRGEEAFDETQRLADSAPKHHWMRHKHGEVLLTNRRDYAAAEAEYAAALKCVPGFWKARAALAEIALCRGDAARADRLCAEMIEAMPERTKPWGHAVRGRLRLWTGRYEEALADLEPAAAAGIPFSLRHRGAAKLLLGRLDEAGADIEDALRAGADAEGLTWRGELRRRRGDFKGAIEDLGAAIRMDGSNSFWALADRALAREASGDAAGAKVDYAAIRRDVLDRFEKELPPGSQPAAVLEAGLKLGRGVRVANEYLFPVWMEHGRQA